MSVDSCGVLLVCVVLVGFELLQSLCLQEDNL